MNWLDFNAKKLYKYINQVPLREVVLDQMTVYFYINRSAVEQILNDRVVENFVSGIEVGKSIQQRFPDGASIVLSGNIPHWIQNKLEPAS